MRQSVDPPTRPRPTFVEPESGCERSFHRARMPSHDRSRDVRPPGSQAAQRAPLSSEEADLAAHLAECPRCRSIAAGMRRDNDRLQAELGAATVSPRVRARVLDEALGPTAHRRAPRSRPRGGSSPRRHRCSIHRRRTSRDHAAAVRDRRIADPRSDADRRRPRSSEPSPSETHRVPVAAGIQGRSSPGRTCTGHDLHAATRSRPSSKRVNRPVSGRESALLMGPGTRTPGQSRAS